MLETIDVESLSDVTGGSVRLQAHRNRTLATKMLLAQLSSSMDMFKANAARNSPAKLFAMMQAVKAHDMGALMQAMA